VRNLDHVIEMLRVLLGRTANREHLYLRDRTVLTRVQSFLSHEGCIDGLADELVDS
jgi:hypothetical protein